MNLEGLREAVAKGRSLSRQTSLNPDPIVTLSLREAEALVKVAETAKAWQNAREDEEGSMDCLIVARVALTDALDELEAIE